VKQRDDGAASTAGDKGESCHSRIMEQKKKEAGAIRRWDTLVSVAGRSSLHLGKVPSLNSQRDSAQTTASSATCHAVL
jgi:hypothetical protein